MKKSINSILSTLTVCWGYVWTLVLFLALAIFIGNFIAFIMAFFIEGKIGEGIFGIFSLIFLCFFLYLFLQLARFFFNSSPLYLDLFSLNGRLYYKRWYKQAFYLWVILILLRAISLTITSDYALKFL